jgi:hypothetical protein
VAVASNPISTKGRHAFASDRLPAGLVVRSEAHTLHHLSDQKTHQSQLHVSPVTPRPGVRREDVELAVDFMCRLAHRLNPYCYVCTVSKGLLQKHVARTGPCTQKIVSGNRGCLRCDTLEHFMSDCTIIPKTRHNEGCIVCILRHHGVAGHTYVSAIRRKP